MSIHHSSYNDLKPVITIPHDNKASFTARNLIPILNAARTANLTDCTWQLGSVAPDHIDPIAYADDLLALWHIQQAIGGDRAWTVIGADLTRRNEPTELQLYADLTDHLTVATSTRSSQMWQTLNPTQHPLWLHLADATIDSDAIERGLRFAQTLGSAAQSGYAVVFQPIVDADLAEPTAELSYFVSLLHKQLLGNRVLRTQLLTDNVTTSLFAHCSAQSNGSFTVMGINLGTTAARLATKLPSNVTGALVLQYVLRSSDGELLFNDRPVRDLAELRPVAKTRKPNRPTSFVMPARTVAFWVFPEAEVTQCTTSNRSIDKATAAPDAEKQSPAERLLQQLIRESVGLGTTDAEQSTSNYRTKRQLPAPVPPVPAVRPPSALHKLFGKFELPKPKKFGMQPRLFQTINNRPDLPAQRSGIVAAPAVSSVYDVYQADAAQALFRSSENVDLPKGDVYLEVGQDDQNADYVAFDEPGKKAAAPTNEIAASDDILDVEDDGTLQHYPNQFLELYDGAALPRPDENTDRRVQAELWEQRSAGGSTYNADIVPASLINNADDERRSVSQQGIPKIVRAREPSWQENQENLRKAKTALEGIYYTGVGHDRHKKMSKPTSAEDDNFFESRRRRRRRAVEDAENDDDDVDDDDLATNAVPTEKSTGNSVVEQLSPYQERLLLKMTKIMHQLQRLIGHSGISNDEPSAAMNTLADELRDIESYLAKSRKKTMPGGGFFAKAKANGGTVGSGALFGKQQGPSAQPLQKQLLQQQQQQPPPADDMPARCKALALSLEQQCLRDIASTGKPTRKRRFPRSLPQRPSETAGPEAWWWDDQLVLAGIDDESMWAADDPRRNMIYKVGEQKLPFVAFVAHKVPTAVVVHEDASQFGHFAGAGDGVAATATATPVTTAVPGDSDDGSTTDRYRSPRFMVSFSRSVEGLLDVVNQHVAGWWHMMS